jgi:hypothetical protein
MTITLTDMAQLILTSALAVLLAAWVVMEARRP